MDQEMPILLRTNRFTVVRKQRMLPTNGTKTRDIIHHPGSVVILPLLENGCICLIHNYRMAVDQRLIELPAGTLQPGEEPGRCAVRELKEETGFEAATWEKLAQFYPAPGILDEQMHLYLASDLTAGQPQREPQEEIENHIVSPSEVDAYLESGKIRDAKTLIGLLMLRRHDTLGRNTSHIGS